MTTDEITPAELNDIQRREMARQVELIAARLRDVAERIERHANPLRESNRDASAFVADILSEYTALGTNIAPIVWGIVRELGRTT